MSYTPGLHILTTFKSEQLHLLRSANDVKVFFDATIKQHQLQKVGEVYHQFENAGFTAVVCLTESHLSIHTWPEYKHVTLDVFLSNYKKNNNTITRDIYQSALEFFKAYDVSCNEVIR